VAQPSIRTGGTLSQPAIRSGRLHSRAISHRSVSTGPGT
jgi:hypothetical protein